jgi:GNAT superfamily N-acetyltransferase
VDVTTAGAREATAEHPWELRPMTLADVDEVMAVVEAARAAQPHEGVPAAHPPPVATSVESTRRGHDRFVRRDAPGAWVAVAGGRVIGVAEAIRRGPLWGLSMLFVHPLHQSCGVGHALLDAALGYAAGARVRMIQSSGDPRAIRRYAMAGLSMHPAAGLSGTPARGAIPTGLPGRRGGESDLALISEVEAHLGLSRTEDVAFALQDEWARLDVLDEGPRRGWALWDPARLVMLGATTEEAATILLWRFLADVEGEVRAHGLTAAQGWAFSVAHAARLTVRVSHAMFIDGMAVPGPWIPSGWYF